MVSTTTVKIESPFSLATSARRNVNPPSGDGSYVDTVGWIWLAGYGWLDTVGWIRLAGDGWLGTRVAGYGWLDEGGWGRAQRAPRSQRHAFTQCRVTTTYDPRCNFLVSEGPNESDCPSLTFPRRIFDGFPFRLHVTMEGGKKQWRVAGDERSEPPGRNGMRSHNAG